MLELTKYNQENNIKIKTVLKGAVLSALVLMSGCASKTVYQEQTGFLDDYKSLITNNPSEGKIVHFNSGQDLSTFNKVNMKSVTVISGIPQDEQTDKQKRLYKTISAYVTSGLKKAITEDSSLILVDAAGEDTLDLELAVSAVEVHMNDAKWNQFSRITLGINVVTYGVYQDEAVRILVESRISTENTLHAQSMHTVKDHSIHTEGSILNFEDVKPALDTWLGDAVKSLNEIRKPSAN